MWKNIFSLRISAFCVTRTLWNSVAVRHYGDTKKNIECHVRLNAKGWIKIEFHKNSVYYIKYKVAIKTLYMIWYMTNWVSSMTQQVKICLQCKRHGFNSWVRMIPWRRNWQPTPIFLPEKKILWTEEETGESPSKRSQRVGHYWASKHAFTLTTNWHFVFILLFLFPFVIYQLSWKSVFLNKYF